MPKVYEKGSIHDVLERFGDALFKRTDFPDSDADLGGTVGWCPIQLTKLVILQAKHGWSDRETVRRAATDMQVKACLDLGIEQLGPSQPTLCRHRQQMQKLKLDIKYQERLRVLLLTLELVRDDEPVLIDSVPVNGAGQHQDTYNLLGSAVRHALRKLAAQQERKLSVVASEMSMDRYLNRSTKGGFQIDWSSEEERVAVLAQMVDDALRVRDALEHSPREHDDDDDNDDDDDDDETPNPIDIIDDILEHDVDRDAAGNVLGVKRKAAGDRLISVTDPDMRSGRKSASKVISGFKAQVIATVLHGFILMARIIKANEHDGERLHQFVSELHGRGVKPAWWGGDHAYGTIGNHSYFGASDERGELVARMARPSNGGRFTKDDFDYDFDTKRLTCPSGTTIEAKGWANRHERRGRLYVFPSSACAACPKRESCVSPKSKKKQRSVFVVDEEEQLIRSHLKRRASPEFRGRLRHRPHIERVIAGFAQCGGKQARRFGRSNVGFDASLSAFAYNLRRLGSILAKDTALAARATKAVAVLCAHLCRFLCDALRALTRAKPMYWHWARISESALKNAEYRMGG